MKNVVWAVIKREYLQRVRSKWFIIGTLAAPLIFLALMIVPALLASRGGDTERTYVVVDRTEQIYAGAEAGMSAAGFTVSESDGTGEDVVDALRADVEAGDIGGILILDEGTLQSGTMKLIAESQPSTIRSIGLRQAVVQSALSARLDADGEEVRALLSGGDMEMEITGEGAGFEDIQFIQAYFGSFFLYMAILLYGVQVMRSVLEEKRDKVVEIVISAMRPGDLMLGKILGVGAVGLTQMTIWIGSAILIFSTGVPALIAARPEALDADLIAAVIPGLGYAGLLSLYFFGGYFIFSGLQAAVGAMCSTDEEAQQAQMPVIMLLIIPVIFVAGIIQDPTSTLSVVMSYIPFFMPILMFARAVAGGTMWWEIVLSAGIMAVTVVAVAWLAGRIYKVGILMTGKRPTLPELLRWVREG